jgi:hypothetical protein
MNENTKLISLKRIVVAASIVLFCVSAFVWKRIPMGRSTDTQTWYALSPQEYSELERQQSAGDGEAAFRLFMFYAFSKHDQDKARRWLRRAIELGHETAKTYEPVMFPEDQKSGGGHRSVESQR